jgi:hypothetical protein
MAVAGQTGEMLAQRTTGSCAAADIDRTKLYEEIAYSRLKARKMGSAL